MNNQAFVNTLLRGHPGRAWCTSFEGDPNRVNGREWGGWLVRCADDIPRGPYNAYISTATFPEDASRRHKTAAADVLAVVLDDVGIDDVEALPESSWMLETSPSNCQIGYALQPGEDPAAVDKLLRALTKAGHKVGPDKSGNNVVRYVRLPGGVNMKPAVVAEVGAPFPCRLHDFEPERRFTVADLWGTFGLDAEDLTIEHLGDDELEVLLLSCEAFHEPLTRLAARWGAQPGATQAGVIAKLEGLMDQAKAKLHTCKDPQQRAQEWQQRRAAVPRYVREAFDKFNPKLKFDITADKWPKTRVQLLTGSTVTPIAVHWVWPGWLAKGKLHIMAGPPGVSKTTIAMVIAAAISRGRVLPGGAVAPLGHVLVWSGEDGVDDTLVPRALAAGADLSRIHFVRDVGEGDARRAFDPARDMQALADTLEGLEYKPLLLVVDPIVSAVAGDSHKNAEVRRGLQPIADVAELYQIAVLGVSHFAKATKGNDPLERVTGSIAFGAVARVVWAAAKQRDEDSRMLVRAKSNIGPDGDGFLYAVAPYELPQHPGVHTVQLRWLDRLGGTAQELLDCAEGARERESVVDMAVEFLREALKDGPKVTTEIREWAEAEGLSEDALRRARRRLGVTSSKVGLGPNWVWALPADAPAGSADEVEV
jgi:hypothetical protein